MYRRNRRSTCRRVVFWTVLILICLLLFRCCCNNMINDCEGDYLLYKSPTIVIDPGHGGFDGGAEGLNNTVEKDINLSISLKLRDMLNFIGFETAIVRDGDYSIEDDCSKSIAIRKTSDLHNRLKLCENFDNPILISIHQNKFQQSSCSGTQVFYGKRNSKSKNLAEKLQLNFKNDINPQNHREAKKGDKNLFLLYNVKCPAVLIECGFISNPSEAELLIDGDYQSKICFIITKSLLDFVNENDKSITTFFNLKK